MNRRNRLVLLSVALAALPAVAAAAPPNVVLIYADDLGFGDVGFNGLKPGLTPNLDRLAREGLNFTDAHATSATCTAGGARGEPCLANRAS